MHDPHHDPHGGPGRAPAQHAHDHAPKPAAHPAPVVHAAHASDETVALVAYLVEHNRSHASELRDVARDVRGPAKQQIEDAIDLLNRSNAKLASALDTLKRG